MAQQAFSGYFGAQTPFNNNIGNIQHQQQQIFNQQGLMTFMMIPFAQPHSSVNPTMQNSLGNLYPQQGFPMFINDRRNFLGYTSSVMNQPENSRLLSYQEERPLTSVIQYIPLSQMPTLPHVDDSLTPSEMNSKTISMTMNNNSQKKRNCKWDQSEQQTGQEFNIQNVSVKEGEFSIYTHNKSGYRLKRKHDRQIEVHFQFTIPYKKIKFNGNQQHLSNEGGSDSQDGQEQMQESVKRENSQETSPNFNQQQTNKTLGKQKLQTNSVIKNTFTDLQIGYSQIEETQRRTLLLAGSPYTEPFINQQNSKQQPLLLHSSQKEISTIINQLSSFNLNSVQLIALKPALQPFFKDFFDSTANRAPVHPRRLQFNEILLTCERILEKSCIQKALNQKLVNMPIAFTAAVASQSEMEKTLLLGEMKVIDLSQLVRFDFSQVRQLSAKVSNGTIPLTTNRRHKENSTYKANSKYHNMNKLLMYNILSMFHQENLMNIQFNEQIKIHLCQIANTLKTISKRASKNYRFDYFSREHYHLLFLKITPANIIALVKSEQDKNLHAKCFHIDITKNLTPFEITYLNWIKTAFYQVFLASIQPQTIFDDQTTSKQNLRRQYCLKAISGIKKLQNGEILVRF